MKTNNKIQYQWKLLLYGALMIKPIHSSQSLKKTIEIISFIIAIFSNKKIKEIILNLSHQMKIDFESVKCDVWLLFFLLHSCADYTFVKFLFKLTQKNF